MTGPRGRYLSELLGFAFTRVVLVGAVLVAMWAFWHGNVVAAVGLTLALAYFGVLLWRYVTAGGAPER